MTGRRTSAAEIVYLRSEPARHDGARVDRDTSSPAEAYAPFPDWQPERPGRWSELPWTR